MITSADDARVIQIDACHDGQGAINCREYLGNYQKRSPGVKFVHDDEIPPGASIGLHRHTGDEEVYVILEGEGLYSDDGREVKVRRGDVCIVRDGQSHALLNTGTTSMRIIVVGCQI
jgi:uncharacterized cupin superfamily protein